MNYKKIKLSVVLILFSMQCLSKQEPLSIQKSVLAKKIDGAKATKSQQSHGCEIVILDSTFSTTTTFNHDNTRKFKPFAGLIDQYYKKFKAPTLQAIRLAMAIEKAVKGLQADVNKILGKNPKQESIHIALGFDLSDDRQEMHQTIMQKYSPQAINSILERCNFYHKSVADALNKNAVAKNIREYYNTQNVYALVKLDETYDTLFCFPLQ